MVDHESSLYPYSPSKPAAIFSMVIFLILLLIHFVKLSKTKTWFAVPLVIGAVCKLLLLLQ